MFSEPDEASREVPLEIKTFVGYGTPPQMLLLSCSFRRASESRKIQYKGYKGVTR